MYQEERSMKTVLLNSTRHHHLRHRVPEQQATSEIAPIIAAPATSSLFTQCDHFLSNVPRFKNAQNIDKTRNCIESDIYVHRGGNVWDCNLIMFKTLLAGTKQNICQNKKTEWKHRENRLHWGWTKLWATSCNNMVKGQAEAPRRWQYFPQELV